MASSSWTGSHVGRTGTGQKQVRSTSTEANEGTRSSLVSETGQCAHPAAQPERRKTSQSMASRWLPRRDFSKFSGIESTDELREPSRLSDKSIPDTTPQLIKGSDSSPLRLLEGTSTVTIRSQNGAASKFGSGPGSGPGSAPRPGFKRPLQRLSMLFKRSGGVAERTANSKSATSPATPTRSEDREQLKAKWPTVQTKSATEAETAAAAAAARAPPQSLSSIPSQYDSGPQGKVELVEGRAHSWSSWPRRTGSGTDADVRLNKVGRQSDNALNIQPGSASIWPHVRPDSAYRAGRCSSNDDDLRTSGAYRATSSQIQHSAGAVSRDVGIVRGDSLRTQSRTDATVGGRRQSSEAFRWLSRRRSRRLEASQQHQKSSDQQSFRPEQSIPRTSAATEAAASPSGPAAPSQNDRSCLDVSEGAAATVPRRGRPVMQVEAAQIQNLEVQEKQLQNDRAEYPGRGTGTVSFSPLEPRAGSRNRLLRPQFDLGPSAAVVREARRNRHRSGSSSRSSVSGVGVGGDGGSGGNQQDTGLSSRKTIADAAAAVLTGAVAAATSTASVIARRSPAQSSRRGHPSHGSIRGSQGSESAATGDLPSQLLTQPMDPSESKSKRIFGSVRSKLALMSRQASLVFGSTSDDGGQGHQGRNQRGSNGSSSGEGSGSSSSTVTAGWRSAAESTPVSAAASKKIYAQGSDTARMHVPRSWSAPILEKRDGIFRPLQPVSALMAGLNRAPAKSSVTSTEAVDTQLSKIAGSRTDRAGAAAEESEAAAAAAAAAVGGGHYAWLSTSSSVSSSVRRRDPGTPPAFPLPPQPSSPSCAYFPSVSPAPSLSLALLSSSPIPYLPPSPVSSSPPPTVPPNSSSWSRHPIHPAASTSTSTYATSSNRGSVASPKRISFVGWDHSNAQQHNTHGHSRNTSRAHVSSFASTSASHHYRSLSSAQRSHVSSLDTTHPPCCGSDQQHCWCSGLRDPYSAPQQSPPLGSSSHTGPGDLWTRTSPADQLASTSGPPHPASDRVLAPGAFAFDHHRFPLRYRQLASSIHPHDSTSQSPSRSRPSVIPTDIHQPHPFGVWLSNREAPTSLPLPPTTRSASGSFSRQGSQQHLQQQQHRSRTHTRNAHSLGTLSDIIAKVPSRNSNSTARSSLGLADVRTAGFPFVQPDSGSEATNTPGSELASVHMCRTASDPVTSSIRMNRSPSDQTHSVNQLESSSQDSQAPSATILRKGGEQLGQYLRGHFSPASAPHLELPEDVDRYSADPASEFALSLGQMADDDPESSMSIGNVLDEYTFADDAGDASEASLLVLEPQAPNTSTVAGAARNSAASQDAEASTAHQLESGAGSSVSDQAGSSQSRSPAVAGVSRNNLVLANDNRPISDFLQSISSVDESLGSASSPIMKLQAAGVTDPSLRDFPANDGTDGSFEAAPAPSRQRTDSRPAITPSGTSRAISSPAHMPLPLALQDDRPTVRRGLGQRAETELAPKSSHPRPFAFPSASSGQFGDTSFSSTSPHERAANLQGPTPKGKNGAGSFIRRLIRRASLKSKSQSVSNNPPWMSPPSNRNSASLPSELGLDKGSVNTSPSKTDSVRSRQSVGKDSRSRNSFSRPRKSQDGSSIKQSRTASIFAPFRARDPPRRRRSSFGNNGPLLPDDPPRLPPDGFPASSSTPFFASVFDQPMATSSSGHGREDEELLESPPPAARDQLQSDRIVNGEQDSAATDDADATYRPLSQVTVNTDNSVGMGLALSSRNGFDFQDSLGLNELAASGRQRSEPAGTEAARSGRSQPTDDYGAMDAADNDQQRQKRPQVSIPRIWQGVEPVESSTHDVPVPDSYEDGRSEEDFDATPPEYGTMPANRYDTATTVGSFRTAASSLDSPHSTSTRRQRPGSKGSKVSLRTLDTPLARHFDTGNRQDSPLVELITNLDRRVSLPSTADTVYQDARTASPSSEYLDDDDDVRPAIAAGPSPMIDDYVDFDFDYGVDSDYDYDVTALRGLALENAEPRDSQSALIETISSSHHHPALDEMRSPTIQESIQDDDEDDDEDDDGPSEAHMDEEIRWHKRDTFGGFEPVTGGSWPIDKTASKMTTEPSQSQYSQHSRFSRTSGLGEKEDVQAEAYQDEHLIEHLVEKDEDEGNHATRELDDDDEAMIVPEVKVAEIEGHLAAVEAALQDNRQEGSFDPTSLRQRMSDIPFLHANMSSASVLSREPSQFSSSYLHPANASNGDVSMPGAWGGDHLQPHGPEDVSRITLAPESHEALADAVRSVRRAISSSQLLEQAEATKMEAVRSVDTLGTESSSLADPDQTAATLNIGEMSMISEATPARAAKRRQEGMRDIEAAYGRMLALVQSSAIGVTPSPQLKPEDSRPGTVAPNRPSKHGQGPLSPGLRQTYLGSPLAKASTKTDEPLVQHDLNSYSLSQQHQQHSSKRNTIDGFPVSSQSSAGPRTRSRGLSVGDARTSTSLSGLMGMPLDANIQLLRQGSLSSEASTLEAARNEPIEASRKRHSSDARSNASRYSQVLSREHMPSSLLELEGYRKRFSSDNNTLGRTSSGAGHTSPSATAKTLGTPRSFATSVSQQSFANILRRHDLEKESLLDSLERARSESVDLHTRNESLTSDLHAEVTRVLELERELERRDAREMSLIGQIHELENRLMELRYLDDRLKEADRSMSSEEGEGSIMDTEPPAALSQSYSSRTDPWVKAHGRGAPKPKASSTVDAPAVSPLISSRSPPARFSATLANSMHRTVASGLAEVGTGSDETAMPHSKSDSGVRARPISLVNGPSGLTREERASDVSSPLPAPRSSSLLRHPRSSTRGSLAPTLSPSASSTGLPAAAPAIGTSLSATPQRGQSKTSPMVPGLSLFSEEGDWSLADEEEPHLDDDLLDERPLQTSADSKSSMYDTSTVASRKRRYDQPDEPMSTSTSSNTAKSGGLSTIHGHANSISNSIFAATTPPKRDPAVSATARATASLGRAQTSGLPRLSSATNSVIDSRLIFPDMGTGNISIASSTPSSTRSVSSRLPRLGLKPSTRYNSATAASSSARNVSSATDRSAASTLSSVFSNSSAMAPPSLGSLASGNNTMEEEIQAELARLGNPQPFMRYYSPPRGKLA